MPYCYINDKIIPQEKASVSIHDIGFLRGYSVFDFFRTSNRIPLFLEAHYQRIKKSTSTLGIQWDINEKILTDIVRQLLYKVQYKEVGFKVIITGGNTIDGFLPTTPNTYIIPVDLKFPTTSQQSNGLNLKLIEYSREFPTLKTTNYLEAIKHISNQNDANIQYDDVLYHENNVVTESSRANFYVVKDNTLITNEKKVLPGVTRIMLLNIANKEIPVDIREISVNDIDEADECFLSSTTKRVIAVTKIDNKPIGNSKVGHITKLLLTKFVTLENDYVVKNRDKYKKK